MGAAPSADNDDSYRAYTRALVQHLFADCKLTKQLECNLRSARAFELAELGKHIVLIGEHHGDSHAHMLPLIFKHMCNKPVAFDLFVEMPYEKRYSVSHAIKLAGTEDPANPPERAGMSQKSIDEIIKGDPRYAARTLNQIRQQVQLQCKNIRVHAVDIRGGAMSFTNMALRQKHKVDGGEKTRHVLENIYIRLLDAEFDLARKRVRKYLQNAGNTHPAHAAISAYLKALNAFGRRIYDNQREYSKVLKIFEKRIDKLLKMCRALAIFATDLYTIARMILKPENNAVLVFYGGDAHAHDLEMMLRTIRWSIDHQKKPPAQTPPAFWGPAFVRQYPNQWEKYLDTIHNIAATKLGCDVESLPKRGVPDAPVVLIGTEIYNTEAYETYGISVDEVSLKEWRSLLTGTERAPLTSDGQVAGNRDGGGSGSDELRLMPTGTERAPLTSDGQVAGDRDGGGSGSDGPPRRKRPR